jgi:hypothetical protein
MDPLRPEGTHLPAIPHERHLHWPPCWSTYDASIPAVPRRTPGHRMVRIQPERQRPVLPRRVRVSPPPLASLAGGAAFRSLAGPGLRRSYRGEPADLAGPGISWSADRAIGIGYATPVALPPAPLPDHRDALTR